MNIETILNVLSKIGFIKECPNEYFQGRLLDLNPYYVLFQKENNRLFHIDGYSIEIDSFYQANKEFGKKINYEFLIEKDNKVYKRKVIDCNSLICEKTIFGMEGFNFLPEKHPLIFTIFKVEEEDTGYFKIKDLREYENVIYPLSPTTITANGLQDMWKDFNNGLNPDDIECLGKVEYLSYLPNVINNRENIKKYVRKTKKRNDYLNLVIKK